jgi:hypothetical protein
MNPVFSMTLSSSCKPVNDGFDGGGDGGVGRPT